MPALNKVFLMGNLTRSPELRYTPSGIAICEFGIAINRRFMSNGVQKEETTFIEINVWQRQAEICQKRLKKGSLVMIEGRLKTDQWEERDTGKKRSRLLVVAERVNFIATLPKEDYQDDYDTEDNNNGNQTYKNNHSGNKSQNQQRSNNNSQGQLSQQNRSNQQSFHMQQKHEDFPQPPEPEYEDDTPPEDDDDENVPF